MKGTVSEYYFVKMPQQLHFILIPELSDDVSRIYRMMPEYGSGEVRLISFNDYFVIMVAEFTPKEPFEKISEITEPYIEISQFETDSSSWRVGNRKPEKVECGIRGFANTSNTVFAYCEAGKTVRFTKILITKDYFDQFIANRYGDSYHQSAGSMRYLTQTPDSPEINFIFQQIRDCNAEGQALKIYLDSKVLELISIVTRQYHQARQQPRLPVKVDYRDKRSLAKTVTFMKKDLAAYPPLKELAKLANMSESRYQMAFKSVYGTTVYEYLKALRMNQALLLLKNSDYDIRTIALKVGYNHTGHFSGLFKKLYGISPKQYRLRRGIK